MCVCVCCFWGGVFLFLFSSFLCVCVCVCTLASDTCVCARARVYAFHSFVMKPPLKCIFSDLFGFSVELCVFVLRRRERRGAVLTVSTGDVSNLTTS